MKALKKTYWKARSVFLKTQYLDRVVPERETDKLLASLPLHQMRALEISASEGVWRGKIFASYEAANYPAYDVCEGILDRKFDFIVAEQVFEHILWPYRAARNVYAMLEDGGYFLIQTPFLLKVHNYPVDCSRWTETGMKYLLAEGGFQLDNIRVGSWGNRMAAQANIVARRDRFAVYNPIRHYDMRNDPMYPVQVWALARK